MKLLEQGESFQVNVLVYKLETKHGWIYEGCARCGTKVRSDGTGVFCTSCKKIPDLTEPK